MKYIKSITLFSFLFIINIGNLQAQQTYTSAENKFTRLLDTKLLKTGEIVLIEERNFCENTNVKLLTSPEEIGESILLTGRTVFVSFNELPDDNWVLIIISNPEDDVPVPYTFHSIVFEDGAYTVFSTDDNNTSIDLESITGSAVINNDELVLTGSTNVYFTDFNLSLINTVNINKSLSIMKSLKPDSSFLYYQYTGENMLFSTEDNFETDDFLASNLDPTFRDIHLMADYIIIQDANYILVLIGLDVLSFLEQGTEIYEFRQHGQNLTYYTISEDSILTFNKIYLDENEELRTDDYKIDLNDHPSIDLLHWDANFKGYSTTFVPLPEDQYEDDYRGINYELIYDTQNFDFNPQYIDISIDDIQYTTTVDTNQIDTDIYLYYADIEMEITLTNKSEEKINDVHLHSAAFEGINCAHNWLKVDQNIIPLEALETVTITARYQNLEYNSLSYLKHPLCIYAMGANNKPDDLFSDNIYCLPLSELTSTEEKIKNTSFSIFPNPAQEYIQLQSEFARSKYLIYTSSGKLIKTWEKKGKNEILDISSLSQGTYFMLEKKSNLIAHFKKI